MLAKCLLLLTFVGTVYSGVVLPSPPPPGCEVDGEIYPIGDDIPSSNPCRKPCFCGNDGSPVCAIVDCFFPTSKVECGGFELLRDPSKCCPFCPKCDINGTKYEPGDSLPLGDPCTLDCECDRDGRIFCEPIAVVCLPPPRCPLGTKLETLMPVGECCAQYKCVNITCEVEGVTYNFGDDIPSEDHCVTCGCGASGPFCSSVGCGLLLCPPNHALVEVDVPGQCCPNRTCVPVTCEVNGVTYKGGEPIPDDDPCISCLCAGTSGNSTRGERICIATLCLISCGGLPHTRLEGECCPVCPPCDYNGTTYESGERIILGDPCTERCECNDDNRISCGPIATECPSTACPFGTKAVSTNIPGECCPEVDCVNVTCEQDGVTYRPGEDIPQEDPCIDCQCGSDGEPICLSVGCPPIRCPPNHALVEEDVPGQCCPNRTCVLVTCEVNGVTYKGGEPIPDDDPCKSCFCAGTSRNSTRGERICSITFCLVSCGGLPSTRLEGECCPVCPPCDYNGTTYESGERIILGDPCTERCVCNDNNRIFCERITTACPLISCPFGTKAVTTNIPGECCPEVDCVNVTCEQNGVTYHPGEDIPQDDPCIYCQCGSNGEPICLGVTCYAPDCPPGTERVVMEAPGVCCPNVSCVNVTTCEVNGITYNVGDKIPHEDPCVSCHCSESGPVCGSVGCSLLRCPPFTELAQTPIPGECCPKQECVPKCPPPCTRKLCKSNQKTLCSIPEGGSCLSSACNVTSCKACYYSEGAPRSLPGGCEKYTCATKRNDITKLQKCMLNFGKCIRTRDRRLYGQPARGAIKPRNFKCYAFPCEP